MKTDYGFHITGKDIFKIAVAAGIGFRLGTTCGKVCEYTFLKLVENGLGFLNNRIEVAEKKTNDEQNDICEEPEAQDNIADLIMSGADKGAVIQAIKDSMDIFGSGKYYEEIVDETTAE